MALFFAHRLGHKAREFESTDARLCAAIDDSSMINEAMKLLLVPGISTLKFPRLTSMQAKSVGKKSSALYRVKPPAIPTHKMYAGINYTDVASKSGGS